MKARAIPTAVHNLPQEPFGLSLGGRKKITRDPALNGCLRSSGKGDGAGETTKESRQPALHPAPAPASQPGRSEPATMLQKCNSKEHTPYHTLQFPWSAKEQPLSDPIPTCPASYLECQQLWWQKPPIPVFISVPQPSTTLTGKHSAHLLTRVRERKSDERDGRKQGLVATLQLLNSNVSLCQQHCFSTSS